MYKCITNEYLSNFWRLLSLLNFRSLEQGFLEFNAYPLKKRKQCIRKENVITSSYTEVDPRRLKRVPQSTNSIRFVSTTHVNHRQPNSSNGSDDRQNARNVDSFKMISPVWY